MTRRRSRAAAPRAAVTGRLKDCLPVVPHRPLDETKLAEFAHWMDSELEQLEYRFRHFTTPHALLVARRR